MMINKNEFGLRNLALRVFSEIIYHCRNTPSVTDQIKQTRKGLQRICMDYVTGLSKMYCKVPDLNNLTSTTSLVMLNDQERTQVIKTLKDFSSIAKSGTLNNLFLTTYAELVQRKGDKTIEPIELLL